MSGSIAARWSGPLKMRLSKKFRSEKLDPFFVIRQKETRVFLLRRCHRLSKIIERPTAGNPNRATPKRSFKKTIFLGSLQNRLLVIGKQKILTDLQHYLTAERKICFFDCLTNQASDRQSPLVVQVSIVLNTFGIIRVFIF